MLHSVVPFFCEGHSVNYLNSRIALKFLLYRRGLGERLNVDILNVKYILASLSPAQDANKHIYVVGKFR